MTMKLPQAAPLLCSALIALPLGLSQAWAQKSNAAYPEKNIRLVIPYPPSGGADVIARLIAPHLSAKWSKSVIVENRAGAAGMIGTDVVTKAPSDGYTLLVTTQGPVTINPSLFQKMPYDSMRDLLPVALLASYSTLLTVHPSLPVNNIKSLIAFAKKNPKTINYASGGNGTTQHLSGELLNLMAGIQLIHVPYKGGNAAFSDLLAGHISVGFSSPGLALPYFKSNRLRFLAVTSEHRSPSFPDIPAIAETLPGFDAVAWVGLFAPRQLSPEIAASLNRELTRVMRLTEIKTTLSTQNYEALSMSTEDFQTYIKSDMDKWAKVISKAGIKVE